jgi:predicted RNA-binding Zn-ribbon protein involved in translation (DUF1610 family)
VPDISYGTTLSIDKGNLQNNVRVSNITATMNATGMVSTTYTLSGTPTTLSTAALAAVGLAFLRNLSTATATTCSIGVVSGTAVIAFAAPRAGETAILRLASGQTYQATGTSGARLRVDITEG